MIPLRAAGIVAAGLLLSGTFAWLASMHPGDDSVERPGIDAEVPVNPLALAPGEDLVALEQGRAYYVQLCMACHGARGNGQGEWAYRVTPRPANLRGERVRGRSDADLERVIRDGLPGTPMTGTRISAAQRRQLMAYVRHLGADHVARR